jgi:hypothetical protein
MRLLHILKYPNHAVDEPQLAQLNDDHAEMPLAKR